MKNLIVEAMLLLIATCAAGQVFQVDNSGNVIANGAVTSQTGPLSSSGSAAGQLSLAQGGAPATIVANSFVLLSPSTISSAYQSVVPASAATGFWFGTLASSASGTPVVPATGSQAGQVTGVTSLSGGSGYAVAPVCTVVNTGAGTGTGATCTAAISGGMVTGLNFPTPNGTGYVQATTAFVFTPQLSMQFLASPLSVSAGGTGNTSLTAHGVLLGEGTSPVTQLAAPPAGTVLTGSGTGADPAFGSQPVLGINASTTGKLGLANGSVGGATVTIQNNVATSSYNFNLPGSAGATGQPLLSAGGGSSPTTWGTITGNTSSFVTGNANVTSANSGQIINIDSSGNAQASGVSIASNIISSYNNSATVGNGVPSDLGASNLLNSHSSIAGSTVISSAPATDVYQVDLVEYQSGTTNCTSAGSVSATYQWTDDASVVQTSSSLSLTFSTAVTIPAGQVMSSIVPIAMGSGSSLKITTIYTASTGGTCSTQPTYTLRIRVTRQ